MSTWTVPATFGAAAVTVASMNTEIRDHALFLKGFGDLITNSTTADTGTATYLSITRALSTETVIRGLVTADTNPRLAVLASGNIEWGSGAAVADTVLSRSAAATLTLNGSLSLTEASISNQAIFTERTSLSTAPTDKVYLWAEDNGSGKTRLVVRFQTGAIIALATEV